MSTCSRMTYRFLGNSRLLVSKFGLGSWTDVSELYTPDRWYDLMKLAFAHGINFFDNAETYGDGLAEKNMGFAIRQGIDDGVWSREDLVITTKVFFGAKRFDLAGPHDRGLSRKHIVEGTKGSLKRLQVDYVDVIFCHQPDPYTPIEETVRAMDYVIQQGWAFYWGTSSWKAEDIAEACEIADRLGLIRPIVEQPEYSMLEQTRVEHEYVDLYQKLKLGLTTWSPLAFGILTGKYSARTPEGSRMENPMYKSFVPDFDARVAKVDLLKPIAEKLGMTSAQLALAWCVSNENVSSVLLGAKTTQQLEDNLKVLELLDKLTPEVKAEIDAIVPLEKKMPKAMGTDGLRAQVTW
ncbi:Voltage-gated potassium channel subunit beta-2 [Phytophthora oleae]|uniref:Voltage-gated potassium channel subunit beta-2 n=1 Tax=Phytophthora oleae TaxID=2107226 RepID=A0ABD3F1M8_9STRA